MSERGPAQLNIPRDNFYGEADYEIPTPRRIARGPAPTKSLDEAADLLAKAKFPVIVSGGGVLFSGGTKEAIALAEQLNAPVVNSYLHNDSFPADHPLWCGPLGYQGSKAGMKLIKDADVVLALGTRLGPFGTLPQHGLDYWPKNAKIIQIDSDHQDAGPREADLGRHRGRRQGGRQGPVYRLANRKLACAANADERKKRIKAEKDAWEKEAQRLDTGEGRLVARDLQGIAYMHPRQMLRELEKAMPKKRHGSRPTSATSARCRIPICASLSELDVRRHELRQLRLCAALDHRRQGGGP